jgi:DNA (cytosine-5)-methyltransferase 1
MKKESEKLTIGSCFSGIGGLELGLEWTGGFETKWQIENDEYASRVLAKHWPNVKRYSDIRDVVRPERVDLICGGFPCQDVSLAGKREGLAGKRTTLWTEMYRLICEVKSRWIVAENVPGLLSSDDGRFFGEILRDLAREGYDAEWGVLSAAGVGAPHLRNRIFIVANSERMEWTPRARGEGIQSEKQKTVRSKSGNIRQVLADAGSVESPRLSGFRENEISETGNGGENGLSAVKRLSDRSEETMGKQRTEQESERSDWWAVEPDVGRVAHGVPSRVDRLKCLGNAVVPQVSQKIGEMILSYEKRKV